MKVCSFLPAATRMLYDMGLEDFLYGVTFECPEEALAEKPKLVRCIMEGKNYSSKEIDTVFGAAKAQGKSLYYVEEELLRGDRGRYHFHPGHLRSMPDRYQVYGCGGREIKKAPADHPPDPG